MKQANHKGFSLVELVVVIAIMAVLVGLLAPLFVRYVEKARQGVDIQNLDSAVDAMEAYFSDKDLRSSTNATVTLTLGSVFQSSGIPADLDPEQELVDMGIISAKGDKIPLKGNGWSPSGSGNTSVPSVTYDVISNEKKYTGESVYYQADAAGKALYQK